MQIQNGFVHWDATRDIPDLAWAFTHYASDMVFVEAPDYVFEGWTFDDTKDGDARFIKPEAPEGWVYDDLTGKFYESNTELQNQNENFIERLVFESINQI